MSLIDVDNNYNLNFYEHDVLGKQTHMFFLKKSWAKSVLKYAHSDLWGLIKVCKF